MTLPNPTVPPDPVCPACSRPTLSGKLVFYQHGGLLHVRCASEALGFKIVEMAERARDAQTGAAEEDVPIGLREAGIEARLFGCARRGGAGRE